MAKILAIKKRFSLHDNTEKYQGSIFFLALFLIATRWLVLGESGGQTVLATEVFALNPRVAIIRLSYYLMLSR